MPEQAPGLFISEFVPIGRYYAMDNDLIGAPGLPPRCLAINPADWKRIQPAERERILDTITRKDAERGLADLAAMLVESSRETSE